MNKIYTQKIRSISLWICCLLVSMSLLTTSASAQCNFASSFGSGAAPAIGLTVNITTCAYGGEYHTITGCAAGNNYVSTSSVTTDYFTVRSGTPAGPVVAFGPSPLGWTATAAGTYYVHTSSTELCGTVAACRTVSVTNNGLGCTFASSFGSAVAPTTVGVATTITTCQYGGEYCTISSAVAGTCYKNTSSVTTDFITVHQGTYNGPIVAAGPTPLNWYASVAGSYYVHNATNSACGTLATCRTTTITKMSPSGGGAGAGCTNTTMYPGTASTAPTCGSLTITTCQFQQEYNQINSVAAATKYISTASIAGTYITVHQGTYNGTIITSGVTPLTWTSTVAGSYFIHYNTNSSCGTAATCMTTTISTIVGDVLSCPINVASLPYSATGNNQAANGFTSQIGQASPDVYYKVIPTCNGTLNANMCGGGTITDTYMHITDAAGTILASNDDNGPSCTGLLSSLNYTVTSGTTYYVVCEGYSTNEGTYSISISLTPTYVTYYADADGDTYGNAAVSTLVCNGVAPGGYVLNNLDCNDANSAINPLATEVCNGIDDNCNGLSDDGLTFLNYYTDADGDGFGSSAASPVSSCSPIAGSVTNNGDCNDANSAINPSAAEVCNAIDDDCDGTSDDGLTFTTYYADADGDGFGNAGMSSSTCDGAPMGYVTDNSDCDDANFTYTDGDGDGFGAGAPVACGVTNNSDCDDANFTYADIDGDGYGSGSPIACGAVTNNIDCWPSDVTYVDADGDGYGSTTLSPCGILDNSDCDDSQFMYSDIDGDGFGSGSPVACGVTNNSDCFPSDVTYDDADGDGYGFGSAVPCGAVTNAADCNDGLITYTDGDGDGHGAGAMAACGVTSNDDCDDAEPAAYPGNVEVCDGIDNDCDGEYDEGTVTAVISPSGTVQICKSDPITLNANAGVGYTYQWYKNGNIIIGAVGSSFIVSKPGDYQVQVNIPEGCFALSDPTTVDTYPSPNANASAPNGTSLCTTVKLKASYDPSYTWQWKKAGVPLGGATAYIYYPTTAGSYTCTITNNFGCTRTTAPITVTACKEGETVTANDSFELYPNPTDAQFTMDIFINDPSTNIADIQVFNLMGEVVYTTQASIVNNELNTTINLGQDVPGGVYIVRATVGQKEMTKQIVVQK